MKCTFTDNDDIFLLRNGDVDVSAISDDGVHLNPGGTRRLIHHLGLDGKLAPKEHRSDPGSEDHELTAPNVTRDQGPTGHKYQSRAEKRRVKAQGKAASKQDNTGPTADIIRKSPRKNVTILCDSVPQALPQGIISKDTGTNVQIVQRAATIPAAVDYVTTMSEEQRDGLLLIHTGTNHVEKESQDSIVQQLRLLEDSLLQHGPQHVALSSVVQRRTTGSVQRKTSRVNDAIQQMCTRHQWYYVNNNDIDGRCLADNVHLNSYGMLHMLCSVTDTIQTFSEVAVALTQ